MIYANDNYGVWQSDFQSMVGQLCAGDDTSGEIARLLAPRPRDITLLKPRHSAFFGSPLKLLLDEMGAKELVLCGLAADMCVLMTAADASEMFALASLTEPGPWASRTHELEDFYLR